MNNLLSCPFCGSEARQETAYGRVCCTNEKCPMIAACFTVDDWNKRYYPSEIMAVLEDGRNLIEWYNKEEDRNLGQQRLINLSVSVREYDEWRAKND